MRELELTPRLQSVADLVPPGARFADIGTDHAYLPVWLLKRSVISRAIAADLRPGPLQRARATAERYGVTDKISFRLCDGLSGIQPHEADIIAIAGMGGETMVQILSAAPWVQSGDCRLILQPMSSLPELRHWLSRQGFAIRQETVSREGSSLYITMLVRYEADAPFTLAEEWLGRAGKNDPLRTDYLNMLAKRYEKVLRGLERSSKPEDVPRRRDLTMVCEAIRLELQERSDNA